MTPQHSTPRKKTKKQQPQARSRRSATTTATNENKDITTAKKQRPSRKKRLQKGAGGAETKKQQHTSDAHQGGGFENYALQTGLIDRYRAQLRSGRLEVADQTDRLMRAHLFFSYMLHDRVDLSVRVGAKSGKIVHGVISELGQAMMGIKGALQMGSYVSAVPLVRMVMERAMVLDILFEYDDKGVYTERITQYEEYSLVQERNYYVFSQKDVPADLQANYDKVIKRYQRDKKTGKTTRYNGIHKKTGVRMLLQRYGYDTLFGGDLYSMTSTVMHGSALVANFMHPKNGLLPLYDETKITGMIDLTLKLADRGVTALRCLVPITKRDAFVQERRSMTGVTATGRITIPTTTSDPTTHKKKSKKTTKKHGKHTSSNKQGSRDDIPKKNQQKKDDTNTTTHRKKRKTQKKQAHGATHPDKSSKTKPKKADKKDKAGTSVATDKPKRTRRRRTKRKTKTSTKTS